MAITFSSSGGNVYDAATLSLNTREKARQTQNDYDIALRQLSMEAQKIAMDFQSRMASNNLQAAMANQRTFADQARQTQQGQQNTAMAKQRAKDESQLMAQRNKHESSMVNQRGQIESALQAQQEGGIARRDQRQQGYAAQNMAQRANNDAASADLQQGHAMQRSQQQALAQLQRDKLQYGFTNQRDQTQQRNVMERDAQQQQYTQQNMYQRETADVSARWQEQIQQARNSGMDFSEKQKAEIKQMDEAFRKNVLNGPMDEGLKQQAMLEHQRKLSAIVPNEKMQDPIEDLQRNVIQDERTGMWFRVGRDSRGYPTYDPIGSSGGGQKEPDPQKIAEQQRKMTLEREHNLQKLDEKLRNEIDPETDTRKFKNQDEIDKEKMRLFAADELFYVDSGLPPHEMYQIQAQRERAKQQADQQQQQERGGRSQYDLPPDRGQQPQMQPSGVTGPSQSPAAPPKPSTLSSSNLSTQLATAQYEGEQETATALEAVKLITDKYGGAPPPGTQEFSDLIEAYRLLRSKGVSIETPKKKREPNAFQDAQGGWMQ